MKDHFERTFANTNRILAVFAHPDDAEIYAGGTLARLVDSNKFVRLVVATNGGKGCKGEVIHEEELAKIRLKEQENAATIMGVSTVNLGFNDGEVENSLVVIRSIVEQIREFEPDSIITHNPEEMFILCNDSIWINHRDHRNTAQSVVDAVYPYSRDRNFFTSSFKKNVKKVRNIFMADNYDLKNTVAFSIDNYLEIKREALGCHKSVLSNSDIHDLMEEVEYESGAFELFKFMTVY